MVYHKYALDKYITIPERYKLYTFIYLYIQLENVFKNCFPFHVKCYT